MTWEVGLIMDEVRLQRESIALGGVLLRYTKIHAWE